MTGVDFGKRSRDYAEHRPGFPASFYDRLETFIRLDGVRAMDAGTGPGVVALELANRGATVTGIDIAPNQIAAARQRARAAGLAARCHFDVARVEQMPFATGIFDLATAAQCWTWFDEARALPELRRVLRPGGHLVVAHYCYLARHSDVAAATEQLILEHNPGWTMADSPGVFPHHIDILIGGGFELVEQFCYDVDQPFSHAAWRGRIRTCNGVGSGAMSDADVAAFDTALADLLRTHFPTEPLHIPHRVWATVTRRP